MALNLLDENKGCPIDRQRFTWKELVQPPISKLDDDAFTRVRIILMNGIEMEALRFSHSCARMNGDLQLLLAQLRRVEQHQASMVNGLIGADHSTLETTIGYEQVAIEVTAAVAQTEPDEYLAQVYRFGMLEDFDHLYRYTALLDRLEGKDANNITQCYTDIVPGRPTVIEHRAPEDDLREHYDRSGAAGYFQTARADHHVRGAADTQFLYECGPELCRSGGAPAVCRDRLDRGAACHAI